MQTFKLDSLLGADIAPILPDLARLRIAVFRDWPYLYDGDFAYERRYLAAYAKAPGAVCIAVRNGGRVVGAATGAPVGGHDAAFAGLLARAGFDPAKVFYCAESVLLPTWRGRGIGHAFFDRREAHARAPGYHFSAFCAVIRPASHPLRPSNYRPLAPFWRARGYRPLQDATVAFPWRDIGDSQETPKPLQVWLRAL